MGQFLAIGLAHEIVTSRDEIKKKNISNEELRKEIEQTLFFDMKLYNETETEKSLVFTLKNQVLEKDLIPFLEVLYPLVYRNRNHDEYLKLLQELRAMPYIKWIDLADMRSNYAFQLDEYGESQYIRFSLKDFRPTIRLDFKMLMLYMEDGKIITEGIGNLLNFFKLCIIETFKEHSLAKSMHVYITG